VLATFEKAKQSKKAKTGEPGLRLAKEPSHRKRILAHDDSRDGQGTPAEEAERIGELFFHIGRVFRDVKPKALKPFDYNLTMAQGRCLWAITKSENCTLRELSKSLGVTPSTASELVDALVRAQLVQRETDHYDRRVVRLHLAKKGHQLFAKHKEQQHAHFRLFLDCLTKEQRHTMLGALEQLNDVIYQVEAAGKETG